MPDPSASDEPPTSETPNVPVPAPAPPLPLDPPPRAGELSLGWRVVTAFCWIGVTMALAAVWNSSVQLGLSTWWLGPRAAPRPLPVRLSPFIAPVLMLLGTINHIRWLPWLGLGASGFVAAIGIVDLGYVPSLAAVELVIAGAAAAVSIASFSGMYRAAGARRVDTAESGAAVSR